MTATNQDQEIIKTVYDEDLNHWHEDQEAKAYWTNDAHYYVIKNEKGEPIILEIDDMSGPSYYYIDTHNPDCTTVAAHSHGGHTITLNVDVDKDTVHVESECRR